MAQDARGSIYASPFKPPFRASKRWNPPITNGERKSTLNQDRNGDEILLDLDGEI